MRVLLLVLLVSLVLVMFGLRGLRRKSTIFHHFPAPVTWGEAQGSGLMMAVNGTDGTTSKVVWEQAVTVLANTDYDFSVWTSTWFGPGELEVKIDGVSLGSTFSTPSTNGLWEETTRTWSSGVSTSATVQIFDTSSSRIGNDFALDDISLTVVPEPASLTILALGGLLIARRRRGN